MAVSGDGDPPRASINETLAHHATMAGGGIVPRRAVHDVAAAADLDVGR
jgi:hypothetical protein